jgi:adenylate cyclase
VEYTILQGKYAVGTVFTRALISLSKKGAQLQSPHSLELLSNLKLKLLIGAELSTEEEHIYAKMSNNLMLKSIFFCFGLKFFRQKR